jgi:plasmid segregation protein ParM
MGMTYRISFSQVYVHMQTYAAYLYVARELNLFKKKVLLLDIGGFTIPKIEMSIM